MDIEETECNGFDKQKKMSSVMIALALIKKMSQGDFNIVLLKCPKCNRFIAVDKEILTVVESVKNIPGLHCPFCANNFYFMKEIVKTEQNEEHFEAYERDLGTENMNPIIHVCSECKFTFNTFYKDVDKLKVCPICGKPFTPGILNYDTHLIFKHPIETDEEVKALLETIENDIDNALMQIEEDTPYDQKENKNLIPFDNLKDIICKIKFKGLRKPVECNIRGYNPYLKMICYAVFDNDNEPHFIWRKTDDIEWIEEF